MIMQPTFLTDLTVALAERWVERYLDCRTDPTGQLKLDPTPSDQQGNQEGEQYDPHSEHHVQLAYPPSLDASLPLSPLPPDLVSILTELGVATPSDVIPENQEQENREDEETDSIESCLFDRVDLYDLDCQICFTKFRAFYEKYQAYLETISTLPQLIGNKLFFEAYYCILRMSTFSVEADRLLDELVKGGNPAQESEALDDILNLAFKWLNDSKGGMDWCCSTVLRIANSILPYETYNRTNFG